MPGHESGTKGLEETIAKIVDMEREINGDIDRLVKLKREIMEVLAQVEDSWCRIVLEKKYLGMMKNREIAEQLFYSGTWVDEHIQKGLEEVEKKMILMGIQEKSV